MNTKRIAKWGVVLFLLAALPGLTAVMAQGPEPAAMEKGETAAIVPWSNTESKPNNTRANAEPPDFVQGGNLSSNVDIDFFYVPTFVHEAMKTNTPILIDVEAASMSSPMQVLIKLWAQDGTLLDTAEYTAGRDPLLYYNIDGWNADYFLSVQAAAGNAGYGPNYKYQLLFSYPLHPPDKPQQLRTQHFPQLRVPAIFVHGQKDPFGSPDEMRAAIPLIPASVTLLEAPGAHDLRKPPFAEVLSILEQPL